MYLLNQHVEVLGNVGCEACNVTLSVIDDQSRGFAELFCEDDGISTAVVLWFFSLISGVDVACAYRLI